MSGKSPTSPSSPTSANMFDLKMCFLDFMRMTGATAAGAHHPGPKQRKSLNELADRFGGIGIGASSKTPTSPTSLGQQNGFGLLGNPVLNAHYMQKYNDVNIIYFNENLSMTSKCNTIKFQRGPVGTFKASPLNQSFSNRRKSIRDWDVLDAADAAPLASFERLRERPDGGGDGAASSVATDDEDDEDYGVYGSGSSRVSGFYT